MKNHKSSHKRKSLNDPRSAGPKRREGALWIHSLAKLVQPAGLVGSSFPPSSSCQSWWSSWSRWCSLQRAVCRSQVMELVHSSQHPSASAISVRAEVSLSAQRKSKAGLLCGSWDCLCFKLSWVPFALRVLRLCRDTSNLWRFCKLERIPVL